ncbi:hypothetical protein JCM16303_006714 [Sporobolomyces ruberrimus]
MMTTRRLSGMPQQSGQQFNIMLETFEAFRKKHQSQNKEIIMKNSELHKTNAELLQHRSVIQSQNLSLKGNLLQKEAELLSLRDRLWRIEEKERDTREELDRLRKRGGGTGQGVALDQVEIMRQALTAAMTALQTFQAILPTRSTSPVSALPSPLAPSPSLRPPQSSFTTSQSQKISLSDRPGSMNLSNRLLVAEPPDLSLIDEREGESELEDIFEEEVEDVDVDEHVLVREPRPVQLVSPPLPLPLPIPATSSSARPSPPLPSTSTIPTTKPVAIAKSLGLRSIPCTTTSSSSTSQPLPIPPSTSTTSQQMNKTTGGGTGTKNRRLSGLVGSTTTTAPSDSIVPEPRRSRLSSRQTSHVSSAAQTITRVEPEETVATEEEEEEEEAVPSDEDEDFIPTTSAAATSRVSTTTTRPKRRKSCVLKEVQEPINLESTLTITSTPSSKREADDEVLPVEVEVSVAEGETAGRTSRRTRGKEVVYEESDKVEGQEEREERERENLRTTSASSRSARRRSILPPITTSREPTPEHVAAVAVKNDETVVEGGETKGTTTSRRRVSTVQGTGGGNALLQARKESLKKEKEKEALRLSANGVLEEEGGNLVEDERIARRGRSRTPAPLSEEGVAEAPETAVEQVSEEALESQPACQSIVSSTTASQEDDPNPENGGGRRARKSVNYALPKLNTKMRRPADYVPVTTTTSSNHSSSSGSHKPRKSTKAPRSSSSSSTTTTTTTTMEAAPPLPPVPTVEGFAGGTRQPSLAGKISQNPSAATTLPFRPVPPTSVSSRYTPTTFAREPAEEEEDDDEWSETKFLETLKRKEKPVRGVVDGSIRSSQSVTS